ncbi:MAG: TetR family transcriptional regulator [Ilumatobacteraceae bacterium]|nr:TetR family transcriptional regulator [Ilumatobacteraceae bacterium]MCU1388868.1 TetR family transcriptional regulator [Ilumatobacteraceae bacterium]
MGTMSTSYEVGGRTAQKERTRAALIAAARDLITAGFTPTVEDAAEAASISRTTAYRYFSSQRALLLAAHPEIGAASMLPTHAPDAIEARLDLVVDNFSAMILDTEAQQRTMLRLSLEANPSDRGELPLRQGRAVGWITEALEGLRDGLGDQHLKQLVLSIRATIGIEAIVWLVDVAGLSRSDAVALTRWSAQALLRHAAHDPPPTPTGK